ncbi:MAG: VOC family protein [Pseudomonadota bacterium]
MTHTPTNFTVWTEIPVRDLDRAARFYGAVFGTELTRQVMGPNETAIFPTQAPGGIAGHLYEGKPAGDGTGPTIHLALPDSLEAGLARLREAGGQVLSEPIAIPFGRFAYCTDPDGNSIGLFAN